MTMSALSVHLLGPLDIRSADGSNQRPAGVKAQELLCYLLLHRDRPILRESLSCLLWVDLDSTRSRKNLRQALWQIQRAIGLAAASLLEITANTVTLRPTAALWLDVAEFEAAVNNVRGIAAHQLSASDAVVVDRAIGLYRGGLLEGLGFDWCIVEREWLQSEYLMLLDKLMVYCEANREYELGVEYGERILRCDRAREYTHRRLMYLHYLRGSRTDALRQFARCVLALDEELSVSPAESTVLLCEQIRADREVDPLSGSSVSAPVTAAYASGAALGDRLRRLQRALTDLQRQVQAELLALEPKPPPPQR